MTRSHLVEFKRTVRREVFLRAGRKCEACSAVLKVGEGEVDHILPVALGGEPSAQNARLLCRPCHAGKTADDIRRIRKADRQRDRHTGAIRPAGKINSPPFVQSPKALSRAEKRRDRAYLASLAVKFNPRMGIDQDRQP